MNKKGYQVLSVNEHLGDLFTSMMFNEDEIHVITAESDKPLVVHNCTDQITFVKDGKGKVVINNDIYMIKKGHLIIIEKENTHSFSADNELKLVHLHWPKENILADRIIVEEKCRVFN